MVRRFVDLWSDLYRVHLEISDIPCAAKSRPLICQVLRSFMSAKTLEGGKVTLAKMGSTYTVNGAKVVCGGVTTANATVYIISSVLMPKS